MSKLDRQLFYIYRLTGLMPVNLKPSKIKQVIKLLASDKADKAKEILRDRIQ